MRRAVGLAVTLVVAGASLDACYLGPDPIQYAALAVVDGRPTAVVAVCGRPTVDVDVYRDDNTPDNDLYHWSVTVTPPSGALAVDVELLGAPRPDWQITSDKPETIDSGAPGSFQVLPLTSLEPRHRYVLDSSRGGPEGASAPTVRFTTDDLTRVGKGQVLAPVDHEHSRVVSRTSFITERCGQGETST